MKNSVKSLEEKLESEMSEGLKNYIRSYIATWKGRENLPSSGDAVAKLPCDWIFYVRNGLYASENTYATFLAKSGLAELPRLLCIMEGLQPYSRCIFQTDDDLRKLPFPPAFQAAFVKVAEGLALSDDSANRGYACDVFRLLLDMGMSRIHQSASSTDFHVLSIADWISVLEAPPKADAESRKVDFRNACVGAYAQSWIRIYYEMEEWAGSNWSFSRENEMSKERDVLDWMHSLRTTGRYSSSCYYLRCLESTDVRWLPYLFEYIYAEDQHSVDEYFPLNFERAFAKYCRHCASDLLKPEDYNSLADALTILKTKFGRSVLCEKEKVIEYSPSDLIRSGDMVVPLDEYARYATHFIDFDIESWVEMFRNCGASDKQKAADANGGRTGDNPKQNTTPGKTLKHRVVNWLQAGWLVYRRIRGLERPSDESSRYWRAKPPSLFAYASRAHNVFSALIAGGLLCALIYGIQHQSEWLANYWWWIGAAVCVFVFREINTFLNCCSYAAAINMLNWEKEEDSYLNECRKEYCLNSYGGKIIEGHEFRYAVHCSMMISRLVGWIGPILESYGDKSILDEILGVSFSVQRAILEKSLPHKGKEWPLPSKRP